MKSLSNFVLTATAIGAAATLAITGSASAGLLASESFEVSATGDDASGVYAVNQTIVGTSPNTEGFDPALNWTGSAASAVVTYTAIETGLSVPGYGGSGGAVEATNTLSNFQQSGRVIDAPVDDITDRLYISVLLNRAAPSINNVLTSAFVGRVGSTGGGPLEFGIINDEFGVNYNTAGGNVFTSTSSDAYTPGETVLLVLRLDINDAEADDDTWYLFADPDTNSEPLVGDAVLTGTGQLWDIDTTFGPGAIRFVEPDGGVEGVTTTFQFDEFRVGTSFASLVIPEPASLALVGLGGLLISARRRPA